ncbi:fimbrial protein, partial [Escherichia coli]|uniref:fimbrial protein n=1 Tax=Escherichia coli TaxID=562 RepID=UPI00203EBB35
DRNRSHWSTSKTPSYTKSVSWQHHPSSDLLTNSNTILKGAEDNGVGFILESNGTPVTLLNITNSSKGYTNLKEIAAKSKLTDTTVSIPITASYYVYDTNKVKSGALEATALINVKYD